MNSYCKAVVFLFLSAAVAVAAPTKKWDFGNPDSEQQFFWELVNAYRLNPEGEIDRVFSSPALTFGYSAKSLADGKAYALAEVKSNDQWYAGWRCPVTYRSDLSAYIQPSVDGVNQRGEHSFSYQVPAMNLLVYGDAAGSGLNGIEGRYADLLIKGDSFFSIDAGIHSYLQVYSGPFQPDPAYSVYGTATATPIQVTNDTRRQLVGCVYEDRNANGRYDIGEGISGVRIMPDSGEYYAETAVGGGYVIDLPRYAGALSVTASGGSLSAPITNSATLTTQNVKLDFVYSPQVSSRGVAAGTAIPALSISSFQPGNAGVYIQGTERAILGLATTTKFVGPGTEVVSNVTLPQTGNTYDQILLQGSGISVTADPAQITRVSFVDLSDDIIQLEFSGAGTLTVNLDAIPGPAAPPVNYNQPNVSYMKGHATVVITGANETTNVSIFTVGTVTAVNQTLFKQGVKYDGVADVAYIAIQSANGKFGGLRAANTHFFSTKGVTGVYAPNVKFMGPVFVGDISAYDAASPVFMIGSGDDVRLTGGSLAQPNNKSVEISGIAKLKITDGTTSHGGSLPAQTVKGRLQQNGVDVTAQVVGN